MTKNLSATLCIHLIRHGETEWSRSGRHTGRTDIPLTQYGEEAARRLGERLRGVPIVSVLSSPLLRARQTCELAGLSESTEFDQDLAEWDYGEYEGQTTTDIHIARPNWRLFKDGCPGGETPTQVSSRVDRIIARLRAMKGNVAVFSHGHLSRVLGVRWIGLPLEQAQHFFLNTASLSILGYEHNREESSTIILWNDVSNDDFKMAT